MKLQAPRGCRAVSIDCAEIALDEAGTVEVPDRIAHDLITYHRFTPVAPVEVAASTARTRANGKGDKRSGK